MGYLADVVRDGAVEGLNEVTAWLATSSLEIEQIAPASAPPKIIELVDRLLSAYTRRGAKTIVVQLLLQVAKARRFAAALTQGTRGLTFDTGTGHLLVREGELEASLPAGTPLLRRVDSDEGLHPDQLLTAFVDEYEEGPSATAADRLANVRRAAERRLTSLLTPDSTPSRGDIVDISDRLDGRTAVLMLYEGGLDGKLATWQLLLTPSGSTMTACLEQMPAGWVRAGEDGAAVTLPASGFLVGDLRREVQRDPGPFDVSPEGQQLLTSAAHRYLKLLDTAAERGLLQGIEHLIIAPHGPTHYVPLHLVGPPGRPLADRFAVLFIATLAQLTTPRPWAPSRTGAAVFALSYKDQPALPTLEDSADEADAIAAICATTAHLDAAATEDAVRAALQRCRQRERPVRAATAASTMQVAVIYLVAQLVGAGALIRALIGLDFVPAFVLTGAAMLGYVVFGGMLATTCCRSSRAL